jgi:hypothetical protein
MTTVFLNSANWAYLKTTVERYFLERRGLTDLPDFENELKTTMVSVIQEVRQQKCLGDIETMNRRVLSVLIPSLLHQWIRVETPATEAPMELGGTSGEPLRENLREPLRENLREPIVEPDKNKDVLFMEKLQELEQTRRLPLEKYIGNEKSPTRTPTVSSTMDVLVPTTGASPASMASHIATVFLPAPTRPGHAVWIQSYQRNWIQYPQRNGFLWNGNIPQGADLTQSRVVSVLLPMAWMKTVQTPFVVLQLEGIGSPPIQLFCSYSGACSDSNGRWGMYVPMSQELSRMRTMACPWTVKLLTATGKMVPMGYDGQTIHWNANTNLLTTPSKIHNGDECWIFGSNGQTFHWTAGDAVSDVAVNAPATSSSYRGQWEDITKTIEEGQLLNFSQQWCILMDIKRS